MNVPETRGGVLRLLALALGVLLAGCDQESPARGTGAAGPQESEAVVAAETGSALDQQARGGLETRAAQLGEDAATATGSFCGSLKVFLETPTETNLALTRSGWISAHRRYKALETVHLLQGGAADARVDAWPALGGYIDRAPGYPHSGIVNDTTIDIDADSLQAQHQLTDASEVSTGFHALEYLLWGDPEDTPRNAALFGKGPVTNKELQSQARARRRDYLRTACTMLTGQLAEAASAAPPAPRPGRQLLAGAGRMLQVSLAGHVDRVVRLGIAEDECAFSGQALCGVLPATEEILRFVEDAGIAGTLRGAAPSLAEDLQAAGVVLGQQVEALETADAWDATLAASFAESLRAAGSKMKEAAASLPQ